MKLFKSIVPLSLKARMQMLIATNMQSLAHPIPMTQKRLTIARSPVTSSWRNVVAISALQLTMGPLSTPSMTRHVFTRRTFFPLRVTERRATYSSTFVFQVLTNYQHPTIGDIASENQSSTWRQQLGCRYSTFQSRSSKCRFSFIPGIQPLNAMYYGCPIGEVLYTHKW